jgi:hypothetical protein
MKHICSIVQLYKTYEEMKSTGNLESNFIRELQLQKEQTERIAFEALERDFGPYFTGRT